MSNRPPSTTSRRAVLASLGAALPAVALAAPVATPHPDADLIRTADAMVALYERINRRGDDDDVRGDLLEEADTLLAVATALPATTCDGLAAKARMLRAEYPATGALADDYDPGERLVQSLVSDLIRQGGRA